MSYYDDKYFRLSGKVSPSYLLYVLVGAVAVALLSFVYALAMFYMPFVYLSVLITVLFAVLVGFLTAKLAELGKARNKIAWFAALAFYFVIFVYIHFAAYASVVFREDIPIIDIEFFFFLLFNPSIFYVAYSEWIVPYGVWSFTVGYSADAATDTVSGAFLLVIWTLEHLIVAGGSGYMLMHKLRYKPFYEESGKWGVEKVSAYAWELQPEHTFEAHRHALETGNAEHFRSLAGANPAYKASCHLVYYSDPGGQSSDIYLTLTNETITVDKKGKETKHSKAFVRNVKLSLTTFQQLEAIAYDAALRMHEQLQQQQYAAQQEQYAQQYSQPQYAEQQQQYAQQQEQDNQIS